jgi:aldose 1-epimerase
MIARGYDHNFVLRAGATSAPKFAARLEDRVSGRAMDLLTTEPGLQLYSGNHFNGSAVGKGNRSIRQSDGIALEPQKFPDSPNRPSFPSTRLDPGETYRHSSVLRFSLLSEE